MPFKVTNIICRFNSASGGPPRTVALIAAAGLGYWRSELFTTDYVEPTNDKLLLHEFRGRVHLMGRSAQSWLGGMLQTTRLFRSYEAQLLQGGAPDIVHIHGVWSPLLAAFASYALRNRIPYIVTPHGMLEPWSLGVHRLRKKIALQGYQGYILANAAAIHATSAQEAENLRRLGLRGAVSLAPNAVEEVPRGTASVTQPCLSQPRVLLFLSRIHPKKGIDLLLESWRQLHPSDWQLAIVGQGAASYVEELKRWCVREQVSNVQFCAHVDGEEREATYRRASALVLPTYSENFGNVVAEALIRGVPVITTTGTPWSALREQRCGWYIEPKVPALKSALAELFSTDSEELRAMGERGRAYVLQNFSIEAVRGALLQMYAAVLGESSPADVRLADSESLAG